MGIPVWFQIWCFNEAFAASDGAINNKYVNNIGSAPVVEDPGPGLYAYPDPGPGLA